MRSNRSRLLFVFASSLALLLLTALKGPILAPGRDPATKALAIFTEVLNLTRSNYVETVDVPTLMGGAYAGVTDAIDPFSYYIPPDQMARYKSFTSSHAAGTGLVLGRRQGAPYVVSTVEGSPAASAAIHAGDLILAVDGNSTRNLALWEIEAAMQGPAGSSVKVKVLRSGDDREAEITIPRRAYEVPSVSHRLEKAIPVVRVPLFQKGSAEELKAELEKLPSRDAAVIIDVRNAAGGDVEEAIRAASLFVPPGDVVKLSGKKVPEKAFPAEGSRIWQGRAIILVDNGTGGPAEVFAGALKDRSGASLVGEPTAGMGVVQRLVSMPSGGALYLTVAEYSTPSGTGLSGRGLSPTVRVDVFPDDAAPGFDPILERALKLAREEPVKAAA
jgi:carboxyl-terminal processing protease